MLKAEEFHDLSQGALELPMVDIQLRRVGEPDAPAISGAGFVRQSKTGELLLSMFASDNPPSLRNLQEQATRPGELLGDGDYYSVEALDFHGRCWTARRVRPPGFNVSLLHGPERWMLEACVPELQTEGRVRAAVDGSCIEIWYPGDTEFPFNRSIHRTETIGKRRLLESLTVGAAEFSAASWNFLVWRDADTLRVSASSSAAELPDHFEHRIQEALEFLLARRLTWMCVSRTVGHISSFRLAGAWTSADRGHMQIPVDWTSGDGEVANAALDLVDRYLSRVSAHVGTGRPTLSVAVRSAIHGAHLPLEAHALGLAVAVEMIISSLFKDVVQPTDQIREDIRRTVGALRSVDVDESFRRRAVGRVTSMASPSAEIRLRELAKQGVVGEAEVKAWKRIRHPTAHGGFEVNLTQDYVDDFFRIMMLLYRLVFEAIGYSGPCRDYGERGRPWMSCPSAGGTST